MNPQIFMQQQNIRSKESNLLCDIDSTDSNDLVTMLVKPNTPKLITSRMTAATGLSYPSWLPETEIIDFDEFPATK